MSRRSGYLTITDPGRPKLVEVDTVTCAHCQRVILLNEQDGTKKPPPAHCLRCDHAVCESERCNSIRGCTPFEKKLEAIEARDRLMRSIGVSS